MRKVNLFHESMRSTRPKLSVRLQSNKDSSESTTADVLQTLGKRMERLLVLGVFILVACFIEFYFATLSERLAADRPTESLKVMLAELENQKSQLLVLFQQKSQPPIEAKAVDLSQSVEREQRVAETRVLLGLPPEAPKELTTDETPTKTETYSDRLRDIVNKVAIQTQENPDDIMKSIDTKIDPSKMEVSLRALIADEARKPVQIWGIETPKQLSFQSVGYGYKFPPSFIAMVLGFALMLLSIGWLASIYLTRQRELLLVASQEDYKVAFPHILNIVPVNFNFVYQRMGIAQETIDKSSIGPKTIGMMLIFRWFVLLLYIVPVIWALAASMYSVVLISGGNFILQLAVLIVFVIVMSMQGLGLLAQEWAILKGKEFSA